jgi:transcriptional regulator with XRE-family HTH domain
MKEVMNLVNTKMIRAQMTLHGYTVGKLAKEIGVSTKTLSARLNNSPEKFTQEQIQKIVTILQIKNPIDIFFNHELREMQQC